MKILIVHNRYQIPGGEDQVAAQEAELLRAHGHQVFIYSRDNGELKTFFPPAKAGAALLDPLQSENLSGYLPSGAGEQDRCGPCSQYADAGVSCRILWGPARRCRRGADRSQFSPALPRGYLLPG